MIRHLAAARRIFCTGILLFLAGCASNTKPVDPSPASSIAAQNEAIRPIVEQLSTNHLELKTVSDDLHITARDALIGDKPEQQLNYIQKAYLHVNEARVISDYQARMLSVLNYIREERRQDYLTLQARGLDLAKGRMDHLISLLDLYGEFIRHPGALEKIGQAKGLIQGNIYLYDKLLVILEPLVHPAGAFTPDPFSPI